jgi:hypothetical protein
VLRNDASDIAQLSGKGIDNDDIRFVQARAATRHGPEGRGQRPYPDMT